MFHVHLKLFLLCGIYFNVVLLEPVINTTLTECQQSELSQIKCRLSVLEKVARTEETEAENQMLRDELDQIKTMISSRRYGHSTPAIAFTARKRDTHNYAAVPSIVRFEDVYLNKGLRYDSSSGLFWPPYNGTYVFSWTICIAEKMYAGTYLMVNDEIVAKNWADGRDNPKKQDDTGTTTVAVHLQANDRVRIVIRDGNYVEGDWWSSFSGWMISAD